MKKFLTLLLILTQALPAFAVDTVIKTDKLKFGLPATGDKTFEFNLGLGAANPKFRWGNVNTQFEFASDGSNYLGLGTGSGSGASGINLLSGKNNDFETGTSQWTASGGTFTSNTSTPLDNRASGAWTPSGSSQTLTSATITVPEGLKGANCSATIFYKTSEATNFYTLRVVDGSANILGSVQLPSPITVAATSPVFGFPCPNSGTVKLQVVSSGSAAALAIDDAFMGKSSDKQISQATFFGSIQWDNAGGVADATTYGDFSNSGYTSSNIKGNLSAPGGSQIGFTASMPAGEYAIEVTGGLSCKDSAGNNGFVCDIGIGDTSGVALDLESISGLQPSGTSYGTTVPSAQFHVSYSSAGTHTLRLQGGGVGTADHAGAGDLVRGTAHLFFKVYKYPSTADQAVDANTVNWLVDLTQDGANPSLSTSSVASYTDISDAGLTAHTNPGSASVQVPCSSTNPSTGLTCGAGNPEVGVVFNVPAAQTVNVCASFSVAVGLAASTVLSESFDITETANTSQTILQQTSAPVTVQEQPGATVNSTSRPVRVCGHLVFASAGQKTVRLKYRSTISGTAPSQNLILGDGTDDRRIHWIVKPVTQNIPAPVVVGVVTSQSAGVERMERATFDGGTANTNCTSGACTIRSQSGSWVTSLTRVGAGSYDLLIAAGAFSAAPTCVCSSKVEASFPSGCSVSAITSSSAKVETFAGSVANTLADSSVKLICMGPK